MLRPLALIIFLMSCDNHRHQASFRSNEKTLLPPEHTMPMRIQAPRPEVNLKLLEKGQALYEIHCIVCHDHQGSGAGILTKKGYPVLPALSSKGAEFTYNAMTKGHEKMPSFQRRLNVEDRWAVAAYVEALVLSRHFPLEKLDQSDREKLP